MNELIQGFVKESLAAKQSRPQIQSALKSAGWPEEEITKALDLYADVDFAVPVPRPKPYLSAREAFVYLFTFVCLYMSAWSLGAVLFHFINLAFPDVVNMYGYYNTDDALRLPMAMLIVSFPVYYALTWRIVKAIKADPEKRASKVRKWLTYLTLFVAASTIIGDLITLLYRVLGGELTWRFSLKVVVVLVIAALVFGYYLWDLRNEEKTA